MVARIPELQGYWFEVADARGDRGELAETIAPLLASLLDTERDTLNLAKLLAARYEEIELLYTISEVLGRTIRLETAAETILHEVANVVGARRASIFVHEEGSEVLRPVAALGMDRRLFKPMAVDHESIAARAFREGRMIVHDPRDTNGSMPLSGEDRGYRGSAFISVPIRYPRPGGEPVPIGVLNLTDRLGTDAFSGGEQRLVSAVASQVGAALENARLVEQDVERQRLEHEMALAHDLHLKLLPSPSLLGADVDAAARCIPASSVGGDFYHFLRLPEQRLGVMLGDVSSHGFAAALVMALVVSAAAIHAEAVGSPDAALQRLRESVADELAETEMFLTLFYGVLDARRGVLRYANAGHPHAFRIGAGGAVERLAATAPPLGLGDRESIEAAESRWDEGDRLVLFSDGVSDARDGSGERFGEDRVLELIAEHSGAPSTAAVEAVLEAVARFEGAERDDRTVLVLRTS